MNRVAVIASGVFLLLLALSLHTPIKDFLWAHPWWHSALVLFPTLVFSVSDIFDSREANRLRTDANGLRGRIADLEAERNRHLEQIADNTKRPVTQAERNAALLRRHIGAKVKVSEEHGDWVATPEIVEVSDGNIVTLFTPCGYTISTASSIGVSCDKLQITEVPAGDCPLRIKVLERYGPTVNYGEITRWEDRLQPTATPKFLTGGAVHYALYVKPGSSEKRSLYVYASKDGTNSFQLVASTGERFVADNKEISKKFMVMQIEYQAEGFTSSPRSGVGSGPYRLFVCY